MLARRTKPSRVIATIRVRFPEGRKLPGKIRTLLASRLASFIAKRIEPFKFDPDQHFEALLQAVARANEEQHVKRR